MKSNWSPSIVGVCAVAVCAVLLTVRFATRKPSSHYDAAAAAKIFRDLRALRPAGWTVREEPLGASEVDRNLVLKTLRYDDATFLVFTKGRVNFALFMAHWQPGKVDLREVNAHTPDTCWMNTGWRIKEKRGEFTGFAAEKLLPGQWRCYAQESGAVQYVSFWHLVGGEPVLMWRNGFPKLEFMWRVFWKDIGLLGREQYFIRISSTLPLEEIWEDPTFREVLRILGPSGLAARSAL